MLWKLFSSDARVMEALERSTVSRDLSPPVVMAANNDEPSAHAAAPVQANGKSRLWLEDWSEKDEARLRAENFWDDVGS